jgi:hypothetical protein
MRMNMDGDTDTSDNNLYDGINTIDRVDIYAAAYSDEYIMYLCSLELSESMRLPKPPWYRIYNKKKKRPKKQVCLVPLDNYTLKPKSEKEYSKQVQKLKLQGVTLKQWTIPAEEEYTMQSKIVDKGRHVFVALVSEITDKEFCFANITQQNTGKSLGDYILKIPNKPMIRSKEFEVGDLVSFEARFYQITTGYVNYIDSIDDSVISYKLNTSKLHKKIN